ncbi:MAG: PadR family transcriptional regulator [Kineosporiaceae bacterium]
MSRTSQTETAVLGALSVEPMSGYALRAAIVDTLGHFWHESFGQIYPALARAEAAGHVRRRSEGLTSGHVFELTDAGRRRLRELLAEPVAPTPARNGLLLRLFFGDVLGPQACRELLADAEQRAGEALEQYAAIRRELAEEDDPGRPYRLLTLSYGETVARALEQWARDSATALRHVDDAGAADS